MKALILLCCILWTTIDCGAQSLSVQIVGSQSTDTLYTCVDNLLRVEGLPHNAGLRLVKGFAFEKSPGLFAATGKRCENGDVDTLLAIRGSDIIGQKVVYWKFCCLSPTIGCPDDLRVRLAGKLRGLDKRAISADPVITCSNPSCKVIAFSYTLGCRASDITPPIRVTGNRFAGADLSVIKKLRPGDRLYIDSVVVNCRSYPAITVLEDADFLIK